MSEIHDLLDAFYFVNDPLQKRIEDLERRIAEITSERDEYYCQAVALFWRGRADDITADQVREAAAKIKTVLTGGNG